MKTLVVCSGGLDSVTLAHQVAAEHELCSLISFDYGQKHAKELHYAQACADRLHVPWHRIDLSALGAHLASALTNDSQVPEGHYAESTMKSTVVPNRNAIMLTIAFGLAANYQADAVATAVHGGDHFIYPDCRPDFTESFAAMQKLALAGVAEVALYTPYVHENKAYIATQGTKYQVPFAETWSCYQGGEIHCGRCGTCVERREAFAEAGVTDPTDYADADFWLTAIQQHQQA